MAKRDAERDAELLKFGQLAFRAKVTACICEDLDIHYGIMNINNDLDDHRMELIKRVINLN